MSKITKYPFSQLYDMASGISSTKEQAGHGSPFVSFSTVFNNYFLPDTLPDLMDTSAQEQETYSIKEGDILITRTSETIDELAMSCVATKDYPCATYSGFTKRLRPKTEGIAYHKYLAFYLRSKLFRKTVTNNAFMTLRASFNEDIFSFLNLHLPEYAEQVSIGDMLYAMEQKMQLNKRIYSELEAMAKTLYDYWFTQFDFPNADGKPYRTSGGEMVWNDQLKREIPKGWDTATINEMTKSYRGVSYDKKDLLPTPENGVLVLRGNNIQNNRLIYDNNVAYVPHSFVANEQRIRAHDIILTMSSGSKEHIGKCTMFQYDSPHTYGAFLTKFTPDIDKVGFVYLSMISDFFKKKIKAICNGTGINNLTNETFDNLVFPKPNESVLCRFEEIVAPIMVSNGMFEGRERYVPEKLSLLTTYSDVYSDVADNIGKKQRKKVEQEVIISLDAPRAGSVVEYLRGISHKKPSIAELKSILIKDDYTDQFDDAKLTLKFGQVRRKISLSEFSGLIAEYDITNDLDYFPDGTIKKDSLYSLADRYARSFLEE